MKQIISLSAFLIAAIIAWWSITESYNAKQQLQQPPEQRYVTIFMNDFEITAMNDSGTPDYRLHGQHMQRYNDSVITEVKQPVFHLLQTGKEWKISADFALINDQKETIQLKNNVLMQQQNIEPAVTIRTQKLLIHTKTQIARTKAPVSIRQGKSHLESIGMIFNNITGKLELSSSVSGYYLPYD